MKKSWLILWCLLVGVRLGVAGVVFEVESTDHTAVPPRVETTYMRVEGRHVKIEIAAEESGTPDEVVYRGDRREMVVIDHGEKSYFVMDRRAMQAAGQQYSRAMKQMEQALQGMPKEQQEMVRKMMRQRMQQRPTPQAARPRSELRKTGERAVKRGYPCTKYEIWRDGRLQQELWVTPWKKIKGGREVRPVFQEMAKFSREMRQSFASASKTPGGFEDDFFAYMEQIDGFPVVTREFDNGTLARESALRSATRRRLDPAAFAPPAGYRRREMFGSR